MNSEIEPFLADGKTHRCIGQVWTGISHFQCRSKGVKKCRAGVFKKNMTGWYCNVHDPVRRQAYMKAKAKKLL